MTNGVLGDTLRRARRGVSGFGHAGLLLPLTWSRLKAALDGNTLIHVRELLGEGEGDIGVKQPAGGREWLSCAC